MRYCNIVMFVLLLTSIRADIIDTKRLLEGFDNAIEGEGCPQKARVLLSSIESCRSIPLVDKQEARQKFDWKFRPVECNVNEISLRKRTDFFILLNHWVFNHGDQESAKKALMQVKGYENEIPESLLKGWQWRATTRRGFFHSYFPTLGSPISKSEESGLMFEWKEGINGRSSLWVRCQDGGLESCVATNLVSATIYAKELTLWNVVKCRTWKYCDMEISSTGFSKCKKFYSRCFFVRLNGDGILVIPLDIMQERWNKCLRQKREWDFLSICAWRSDGIISVHEIWSEPIGLLEKGMKRVKQEDRITSLMLGESVKVLRIE